MPELIEDLHVSTQGDGPEIDAALALAKTALQAADVVALDARVTSLETTPNLPPMPNAGTILMAIDGGEVQAVEIWPVLINQLTLSFTAAAAILANRRRSNL